MKINKKWPGLAHEKDIFQERKISSPIFFSHSSPFDNVDVAQKQLFS